MRVNQETSLYFLLFESFLCFYQRERIGLEKMVDKRRVDSSLDKSVLFHTVCVVLNEMMGGSC